MPRKGKSQISAFVPEEEFQMMLDDLRVVEQTLKKRFNTTDAIRIMMQTFNEAPPESRVEAAKKILLPQD